jgi:hypothetical protein
MSFYDSPGNLFWIVIKFEVINEPIKVFRSCLGFNEQYRQYYTFSITFRHQWL